MNDGYSSGWPNSIGHAHSTPKKTWWLPKAKPAFVACLCIVYIISPIDLVPEALLGPFGLFDDLGALFMAISAIKKAFRGQTT